MIEHAALFSRRESDQSQSLRYLCALREMLGHSFPHSESEELSASRKASTIREFDNIIRHRESRGMDMSPEREILQKIRLLTSR